MKNSLLQTAQKMNISRKYGYIWQRIVLGMAAAVVFGTTYVLILPAITMHEDPICGLEEHVHTAECLQTVMISSAIFAVLI